jgi:GTP-binding protein
VSIPQVAIVGRPNVGKSSIFNWLAGRRIAIVDPTSGVTRDRITTLIEADSRFFEVTDTGGIGITDRDNLTDEIERQIQRAIDAAHLILFVVDARDGITALDEGVAERLRHVNKPVLCVANKCDEERFDLQANEFYMLGRGKLVCVSAKQNRNRRELLRLIVERLPPADSEEKPSAVEMRVAIVGKRNVGKSTFINAVARAERVIVSEVPGTTRDAVDVRFELDGRSFVAIDTAGVQRRTAIKDDIEFYSLTRAQSSIRRADVVLLFLDPTTGIAKVEKQLAATIVEEYKPCIFVVNKWDLMLPMPTGKFAAIVQDQFRSMQYVPIVFVTAKTGKNMKALLNLAQHLFKQASTRVSTSELNRAIQGALKAHAPPSRENRPAKIYYATQAGTCPPTLVLFCNSPRLFDENYQRYLVGTLRDRLPFQEVPIKLYLRRHREAQAAEATAATHPEA